MYRMCTALLLALCFATPALGFTPSNDCDGWSAQEFPAGPGGQYYYVVATLYKVNDDDSLTFVESSTTCANGPDDAITTVSGTWESTLETGCYYVAYYDNLTFSGNDVPDASGGCDLPDGDPSGSQYDVEGDTFEGCTPPDTNDKENRTPGYWKTHPDAWGVDELCLGSGDDEECYSQECLLEFLWYETKGDIRVKLVHHLIAAKLNVLNGTDASIQDSIDDADDNIGPSLAEEGDDCAGGFLVGPAPAGAAKGAAEDIKDALDAYNNNYEDDEEEEESDD